MPRPNTSDDECLSRRRNSRSLRIHSKKHGAFAPCWCQLLFRVHSIPREDVAELSLLSEVVLAGGCGRGRSLRFPLIFHPSTSVAFPSFELFSRSSRLQFNSVYCKGRGCIHAPCTTTAETRHLWLISQPGLTSKDRLPRSYQMHLVSVLYFLPVREGSSAGLSTGPTIRA